MAENFGVEGRGAFYDQTGTIRDVIQNHLFQILCNLAMEPPVRTRQRNDSRRKGEGAESDPADRAQTIWCAGSSAAIARKRESRPIRNTETFAALQLEVDSWRWKGVPFYIRAGKEPAGDLHGGRRHGFASLPRSISEICLVAQPSAVPHQP